MSDTKKPAAAAEAASLQEDMDAVMRKYDRESATRIWAGKPKIVISVIIYLAAFSLLMQSKIAGLLKRSAQRKGKGDAA